MSKIFCIVAIAAIPVACVGPANVPSDVTTTPADANGVANPNGGGSINPNVISNPNDPNKGVPKTPAQQQLAVTIVKADALSQCVSKAADGTVQLQTCSGDGNQFWSLRGGLMANQNTCLNAKADSATAATTGTALEFVGCDANKATQLWTFEGGGVHLAGTQLCVSLPSGTDKAVATLDSCTANNAKEVMTLNHTDGKTTSGFTIGFTSAPGKCLTLAGDKLADGSLVELDDCRGAASQQWTWDLLALKVGQNLCLSAGDLTDGAQLESKTCGSDVGFQWNYEGGTVRVNRTDSKTTCADLAEGKTDNGNRINGYGCVGQPQQQWVLGVQ